MRMPSPPTCLFVALCVLTPNVVRASGGDVKLVTDDTWDGSAYCLVNPGDAFTTAYFTSDYDVPGVVCGARVREVNGNPGSYFGALQGALYLEDPGNPGYPDIVGGLIATADPASEGSCGGDPNVPRFWTFGGGSGIPAPATAHFLVAFNPAPGPGPTDCCALLLDTDSPSEGRSFPTSYDHFLELVVFEDAPIDLQISLTGSSRFPGDPGRPVVVTRRPNAGATVSDDEVTLTIVVDNNRGVPSARRLDICADKSVVNPKKGLVDAAQFFEPAIANPVTFPVGRTVIVETISRPSLKAKIANIVDNRVAVNVPFRVIVDGQATTDPCLLEKNPATGADEETDVVGLRRRAGRHDDDSAEGLFNLGTPGLPDDSLEERFREIDLPGVPFAITGLEFVGADFLSGHPGLDALELRTEDAVFSGSPDLGAAGLLATCGTRDGVGEIPASSNSPLSVTCDTADVPISPPLGGDLFVLAVLAPSVPGTEFGIAGDTSPSATLLGDASYVVSGSLPATPVTAINFMLGFRLDGDGGTLAGEPARDGDRPVVPRRAIGEVIFLDAEGRRLF